jgi:hypothetical protein
MNIQTDKMQMVFRRDNEYGTNYSIGVSKKKQDGSYDNAYIPVQFKRDVSLENQTNIYIKKAWLSFYKNKEGKAVFYIFISEFNTVHEEANSYKNASIKTETNALESLDLRIDDSELPF